MQTLIQTGLYSVGMIVVLVLSGFQIKALIQNKQKHQSTQINWFVLIEFAGCLIADIINLIAIYTNQLQYQNLANL